MGTYEFIKTAEKINIKTNEEHFIDFGDVQKYFGCFSKFYKGGDSEPHFVLFAMQWCQPVWDGIEDLENKTVGSTNDFSYVQNENLINLNMHIVTMYLNNGKVYGTTRHGRDDMIDIHAQKGISKLFAVHSAKAEKYDSEPLSAAGKHIVLRWKNRSIRYLHLHSVSISHNSLVMAGEILGVAGRTGNFANPYNSQNPTKYPDHVHLDDNYPIGGNGIISNRNEIDIENRKCIPSYDYPLLFPCKCIVSKNNEDPSVCDGKIENFASTCWAKAENKCPKIN